MRRPVGAQPREHLGTGPPIDEPLSDEEQRWHPETLFIAAPTSERRCNQLPGKRMPEGVRDSSDPKLLNDGIRARHPTVEELGHQSVNALGAVGANALSTAIDPFDLKVDRGSGLCPEHAPGAR